MEIQELEEQMESKLVKLEEIGSHQDLLNDHIASQQALIDKILDQMASKKDITFLQTQVDRIRPTAQRVGVDETVRESLENQMLDLQSRMDNMSHNDEINQRLVDSIAHLEQMLDQGNQELWQKLLSQDDQMREDFSRS